MTAFTTVGQESTSPQPVIPSSVSTRMRQVSWVPSQSAVTLGNLKTLASTDVIFTALLLTWPSWR